ncbi:hypothetical protein [Paenibacillus sp. 453mf]|uniref:hypothetical protein n=1 Tax=Paenibacillus sp. 453mf TaxID=1761874 RepID=UPI0008E19A3F|nr:hypothetical protein [Paenibacillus sp. 453mf]SFS51405.1 hypothetical protein SAMN04488601_1011280 [Paenibacillus sp. 453mf]
MWVKLALHFLSSLSPVASQKSFGIQKISLVAGGRIPARDAVVAFFELPLSGCFAKVVRYPKNFTLQLQRKDCFPISIEMRSSLLGLKHEVKL